MVALLSEQLFEHSTTMAKDHPYENSLLAVANERLDIRRNELRNMVFDGGCTRSEEGACFDVVEYKNKNDRDIIAARYNGG